ncbi:DegT/DnrJ/EryC1/StrS family aminotransferase [Pseudidiomarina terrestris]|uniref:DegT/DnrJ/EryC1/StrS family aminotransferase n=1 Tax=Pseudidiomarina terrestris TaxID=2820060 RepID=UPI00265892C4|nr:DegT/DnrJ/EryC1/StrS family aminotransferase [Pseudidiomarina sp. 1ASP75-5]
MKPIMIPVTKPFLPDRKKLDAYIDGIYEREWLTNNGPLAQELTRRLEGYLGVENLLLVANGTLALQIAYRVLGLHETASGEPAEAITTPFTFVATPSSLGWDGIRPVFADIDAQTWCLDPEAIAAKISPRTTGIVPVHVYGNACDVEAIDQIAEQHDLKVVYDAAHAFGVNYKGESLLKWGDAATLSFHATKVFHTIEGGAIIFKRKEDLEQAKALINFGITGPDSITALGINAKMNEFQAAMGLCVLDEMDTNLAQRGKVWQRYNEAFAGTVTLQQRAPQLTNNFAYFPVVAEQLDDASQLFESLKAEGVMARRYFYPSLDGLEFLNNEASCFNAQKIARQVLCLPVYYSMSEADVEHVIAAFENGVKNARSS